MYKIVDINWERANVTLKLNNSIKDKCYLVSDDNTIELEINKNIIRINITNLPTGQSLEMGIYRILINDEIVKIDSNIIDKLDDCSRIFKYRNNYAMLVDFKVDKSEELLLNIDYMIRNYKYKKNILIEEGKNFKEKSIILLKIILIAIVNFIYKILRLLNYNKNNTILFLSETTDKLSDNMEYLYINIKNKTSKKIKFFLYNKSISKSAINFIKEIITISSTNTIIVDNYVSTLSFLNLSKEQRLFQLWHAGVGFKAVGYARFGKEGSPHPFVSSHRKYTNVFVDSPMLIDVYKEVFGCNSNKIIPSGMPRLDNYFNKDIIKNTIVELENKYIFIKNKKVILFAPTYRGASIEDAYYDYDKIDLKRIDEFCKKNDFIFLVKMHPFISEKIIIPSIFNSTIIDVSKYDINDFIYFADILITDYSSCAYEFSLFNRPIIFYRFDKKIYEYFRPMHTLNIFGSEQYEVEYFDDLMKILDKIKNVKINDRFSSINKHNNNSCDIIKDKILHEE